MSRRPLSFPISLAIFMLVLLVLIIVGWVLNFVLRPSGATNWTFLILGLIFLGMVVVGVVLYLTLSIKAINLNRRQSNFIDSVTHELKSPIASLKLYLQTLKRRPVSQEEQSEFYKSMLEDVERLDSLINHILSTARLDKHAAADNVERVELADLLDECTREVCNRYRVPATVVSVDVEDCELVGSRLDFGLIFRNLIDNAIKYADTENPEVGIHADFDPQSATAVVQISDNGQGIPGPLRRKIFRRFVRLGTELERKKPGTGLGLYIVRTLVDRWKGRVQVFSREPGGTTFRVTLPNATAMPAREASDE